jgi:hypothetical protein
MQTKIRIGVSKKSALLAGRSSYGEETITLSDADVAALTPEEREEILEVGTSDGTHLGNCIYVRGYQKYIEVQSPGLAGVREALAIHREMRLADEQKQTAEREQLIAEILGASDDKLLTETGRDVREYWGDLSRKIPWDAPKLGALRTRLDGVAKTNAAAYRVTLRGEAESELAKMRADPSYYPAILDRYGVQNGPKITLTQEERDEVDARSEELQVAAKAVTAARAEVEREQLRAWVLAGKSGPDAQRAAEGGYDVTTAVIDSIEAALPEYAIKDWGRPDWTWEERRSPNAAALDLHAEIGAAIATIALPACVTLTVTRAQRIEHRKKDIARTGVVVTMACPTDVEDRYYLYFSDEPSVGDDDSADDE